MEVEDYRRVVEQLDALISVFENHENEAVREQATALLSAVDMLHREALTRLMDAVREALPEEIVTAMTTDPVIATLLALYGLIDLGLPEEEAPRPTATNTIWVDLADARDLPPGGMRGTAWENLRVLLVNIGGEVFAFRNACDGADVPLQMGRLEGHELICPSHGCRYDARTGCRLDGGRGRLEVLPIAVRGHSIQIAVQRR